ncbi:radical SAM protein [Rathayibacter sp. PhB152]|uniref:radical SAM protein n=1 Tax=Rathayibacter sp. PhB152 TaxID=2485190 RepID=UPI000F4D21CA
MQSANVLSVCFEPTNACPGKCPYCLIESHVDEASPDDLDHVLGHLLRAGVRRIGFGGGEPLLRPDLFEMGRNLRNRDVGSLLRTSGMFPIDPKNAADAFDWIDLSMDSSNAEIFKRCRPGVPLEVLQANIRDLITSGARVRVSILLTSRNVSSLSETVRWLAEEGVSQVRVQRLVQRGKAVRTWSKLKLSTLDEDAAVNFVLSEATNRGIYARELMSVGSTTLCIVKANGEVFRGTPTGIEKMASVCNGDWFTESSNSIGEAQRATYMVQHDAHTY